MGVTADRVALQVIESSYANVIRDQVVAIFASLPERSLQLPTPTDGRMSYVADIDQLFVGVNGQWRPVAHDGGKLVGQIGSVAIRPSTVVSGTTGGGLSFMADPTNGDGYTIDVSNGVLRVFSGSTLIALLRQTGDTTFTHRVHASAGVLVSGTAGYEQTAGPTEIHGTDFEVDASGIVRFDANGDIGIDSTAGDVEIQARSAAKALVLQGFGATRIYGDLGVDFHVTGLNWFRFRQASTDLIHIFQGPSISGGTLNFWFDQDLPELGAGGTAMQLLGVTPGGQLGRVHEQANIAPLDDIPETETLAASSSVGELTSRVEALEAELAELRSRLAEV